MVTVRPSASVTRRSTASVSAFFTARFLTGLPDPAGPFARSLASASTWRTLRPRSTISRAIASGSSAPIRMRAAHGTHHHRLDDAALLDRCRKLVELAVGEMAARIARVGADMLDRHAALVARALGCRVLGADVADERGKAASQSRSAIIRHCH